MKTSDISPNSIYTASYIHEHDMNNFFEHLRDILFLDIETASLTPSFEDLPERLQDEWVRKTRFLQDQEEATAQELFFDKAGIHAEFGKVVCIGVGFFMLD